MQRQRYYLEVDEDICFKASDSSDDESMVAVTPESKPSMVHKLNTLSQGKVRPALQCIDQNVPPINSHTTVPLKTPQKPTILTTSTPAADDDDEADSKFFDAVEMPPDLCRDAAPRSPCRGPTKTPSKTPSFFKKLLSWGSSSKYPPNNPVEKSVADVTADRITGQCPDENALPDYLVSPPRDTVASEAKDEDVVCQVNRELLWQDEEEAVVEATNPVETTATMDSAEESPEEPVPDVSRKPAVEIVPEKENAECALEPVEIISAAVTEKPEETLFSVSGEPCPDDDMEKEGETIELALDDSEEMPSPAVCREVQAPKENRRGSGIGLSLASSMSHAETLLLSSTSRLSGELAMLQRYGTESEHTPIYSQAEMDSALENLRFELSNNEKPGPSEAAEAVSPAAVVQESSTAEMLQALQSELDMQKMQSAALYHQIKSLNDTIAEKDVAVASIQQNLAAQHEAEMKATIQLVEQATRAPLEEEIARLNALVAIVSKAEAEAKKQLREKSEKVAQFQNMEVEHAASLKKAVADEKGRMYKKMQVKFDEGNEKYQSTIRRMKELAAHLQSAEAENEQLKSEMEGAQTKTIAAQTQAAEAVEKTATLQKELMESFSTVLEANPQKSVMECAKAIVKMVSELQVGHQAATTLVGDLEKQLIQEVAEKQRLEGALKAAEVLVAANSHEVVKMRKELEAETEKNMSMYGKMVLNNKELEEKVQQITTELAASNERCLSLRAMNEELLQMLEQSVPAEN